MAKATPGRPPRDEVTLRTAIVVVAAGALLWPLILPGLPLSYDMVWTPWTPSWDFALGLGPGLPRAVPGEALITSMSTLVPTWVVARVCLLAVVVLGALGVARFQRTTSATVVAVATWSWGAFVVERMVLGHWMLLAAAAVVPWVCRAAPWAVVHGTWAGRWRLWMTALPAALTPSGAVLWLAVVAVVVLSTRTGSWRRRGAELASATALWAALAAPWVVAGWTGPDARSDPAGVDAFAVRAENGAGVLGSVLVGGGIWNAEVVPVTRDGLFGVVTGCVLVVVAAMGVASRLRDRDDATRAVVVCGALALVLVLAATTAPGAQVLRWAVVEVPGAGLLRDAHKWLAPWAVAVAVGSGWGVDRAQELVRRWLPGEAPVVPAALAAVCLAVLAPNATAVASAMRPVEYPPEWGRVRNYLAADDSDGAVAVVPWGAFRAFGWTAGRTTLDPAQRALPGTVLTSDALAVGTSTVAGEDPLLERVGAALAVGDEQALTRAGVGFILVHRAAGATGTVAPVDGEPVVGSPSLTLLRLAEPDPPRQVGAARRDAVVVAHLGAGFVALVVLAGAAATRRARKATYG